MLKFFNTNTIKFLKKLDTFLEKRKLKQQKLSQAKFEKFY